MASADSDAVIGYVKTPCFTEFRRSASVGPSNGACTCVCVCVCVLCACVCVILVEFLTEFARLDVRLPVE
jgi:hypothetical protein